MRGDRQDFETPVCHGVGRRMAASSVAMLLQSGWRRWGVFAQITDAPDNLPVLGLHFALELPERVVPERVVREEQSSDRQKRIGHSELPQHVIVGVQAV